MHVLYTIIDASSSDRVDGFGARADLPPAYRGRLDRMRSIEARRRTLAGLWLLDHGLRARGFDDGALARLGFSVDGRPEIDGGPAFNISHSEALVACAIAPDGSAIGLDVEVRRPRSPTRLARLLSGDERAIALADPPRFFDYWCAREATVKASGRVGLKRIRALSLAGDTARLDERDWHLRALDLDAGYAACLASDRPIGPVDLRELSLPGRENTGPHKSSDQ